MLEHSSRDIVNYEFSEVYLLLHMYLKTDDIQFKNLALKTVHNTLNKNNNDNVYAILNISKLNIGNYGLAGFPGLGLILLSAKSDFTDLSWVELFI